MSRFSSVVGLLLLAAACSGTDGKDGAQGGPGAQGTPGTPGADGPPGPAGTPGSSAPDPRTGPQCTADKAGHSPEAGPPISSEIQPAPASIGADVPATYFGPPPSSVNPNLVGPLTLLTAGPIDFDKGTITLPLYKGTVASTGKSIYYVLTDVSDVGVARELGLNYSTKLRYLGAAARQAHTTTTAASLVLDNGTVDFSPDLAITAGDAPSYFPPKTFTAGSLGDADYTPIVHVVDQDVVYNAPAIAYDVTDADLDFCQGNADHTKVHDKVVAICPGQGTVTLKLTTGFSFGKPVLYLSTEASDELPATLETATNAPGLKRVRVGGDDSAFSGIERLFSFTNGPVNLDGKGVNPQRQGLNSAIHDGGGPLNVLGGIPHVALDYSPLWDFNLGEWTANAIAKGYRSRLDEEFQILGFVQRGFVTGPGGAAWGSTGIIVNCPIVHRFL